MNETSAHGSDTPAPTPCSQAYPVSGTIISVNFHNEPVGKLTTIGGALVTGPREQFQDPRSGDFFLFFSQETRAFEQQEHGCQSVSLNSLQVGQRIKVQIAGFVLQSSPPQVFALQILMVADGRGGS